MQERFRLWGEDLESHLLGNIYGKTDSWAVFWALTVIMKNGYCISPYESFINNIGFDGTGVHSGIAENTLKLRSYEKRSEITLPDKIEWVINYKKAFAVYHPWTSPVVKNEYYKNVALDLLDLQKKQRSITIQLKKLDIHTLIIWGKGRLCDYIIEELEDKITIEAIVETDPHEKGYKGIPIINWKDIPPSTYLIILIPGYDIEKVQNMIENVELQKKIIPIDQLVKAALLQE